MIEVTHGPYKVDNNIFASDYNFDNVAQGGAYIHNLCCGTMRRVACLDRSTPYHFPHSTEVAGSVVVYGGDDRIYQNIFLGGSPEITEEPIQERQDMINIRLHGKNILTGLLHLETKIMRNLNWFLRLFILTETHISKRLLPTHRNRTTIFQKQIRR